MWARIMNKNEIKQRISEGWIKARTIIEIIGKPKKHVDTTLKDYVKAISGKDTVIIKEDISRAKKHEEKLYAAFAELEVIFKNLNSLVYFCFDYMPSSIEIDEPGELVYTARELTLFINDMQGRLHDVNMAAKQLKQQNLKLNENFSKLLKNFIVVASVVGKTIQELEKIIGLPEKHMKSVLKVLIKEKRMKKQGEKYITIK